MVGTGPASYIRGMPLRPPMPTTLPPLVDAFEETVLAVIELGRGCSAADFELPTACPGWTVKDQISHVADIESILAVTLSLLLTYLHLPTCATNLACSWSAACRPAEECQGRTWWPS